MTNLHTPSSKPAMRRKICIIDDEGCTLSFVVLFFGWQAPEQFAADTIVLGVMYIKTTRKTSLSTAQRTGWLMHSYTTNGLEPLYIVVQRESLLLQLPDSRSAQWVA